MCLFFFLLFFFFAVFFFFFFWFCLLCVLKFSVSVWSPSSSFPHRMDFSLRVHVTKCPAFCPGGRFGTSAIVINVKCWVFFCCCCCKCELRSPSMTCLYDYWMFPPRRGSSGVACRFSRKIFAFLSFNFYAFLLFERPKCIRLLIGCRRMSG